MSSSHAGRQSDAGAAIAKRYAAQTTSSASTPTGAPARRGAAPCRAAGPARAAPQRRAGRRPAVTGPRTWSRPPARGPARRGGAAGVGLLDPAQQQQQRQQETRRIGDVGRCQTRVADDRGDGRTATAAIHAAASPYARRASSQVRMMTSPRNGNTPAEPAPGCGRSQGPYTGDRPGRASSAAPPGTGRRRRRCAPAAGSRSATARAARGRSGQPLDAGRDVLRLVSGGGEVAHSAPPGGTRRND